MMSGKGTIVYNDDWTMVKAAPPPSATRCRLALLAGDVRWNAKVFTLLSELNSVCAGESR